MTKPLRSADGRNRVGRVSSFAVHSADRGLSIACGNTSTSSITSSPRRSQERPHRHRYAQRVRLPDAVRPGRGLSAGHDQEAAPAVDHSRAALVPPRRDERRSTCARTASRSGTSGPTPTASSAPSTASSGGAGRRPTAARSTRCGEVVEQIKSNPDSRRLIVSAWNVGEIDADGAAAVPPAVSVLRGRGPALVPAVPAQRRRVPRRAVQHRLLRAAHDDGRPGDRPGSRASSSTRSATRTCTTTTSSRPSCSSRREPRPLPTMRLNPAVTDLFAFRFEDFTLENYDPHPHIKAPVAV